MTLIGANALKELNSKDFRVLNVIEIGMSKSQYVSIEEIIKVTKFTSGKIEFILRKCHKLDLIHRWTGHYVGYELTIHGYDALALNALYERKIITSIGREKGVGKESKVFYALTPDETEIVLKLHRVGYTSFNQVKKKRRYTANKRHISELYSSRLSAESEVGWLKHAQKLNLPVPKLISSNRHIIAQELIIGENLNKLRYLSDPEGLLTKLLEFLRIAWQEGEFVHGDFSEHNIIINMDEEPYVIDFPQAVESYAPNGDDLLRRDIKNTLTFFERKFGIVMDEESIYDVITNPIEES